MRERRLVGIDLGIASAHTAQVLRAAGSKVCRHHCWPRLDSLLELEQAALAEAPEGTRLEVVMEPTGSAWWSIAVNFIRRGHLVYRVSSAKAHDLRRFLSRHAKSNSIHALTLAKLPIVGPQGLLPLELGSHAQAALDRRVRVCDRLTRLRVVHRIRLKDLVRPLLPAEPAGWRSDQRRPADPAIQPRPRGAGAHPASRHINRRPADLDRDRGPGAVRALLQGRGGHLVAGHGARAR
jgi:hypothetical protein